MDVCRYRKIQFEVIDTNQKTDSELIHRIYNTQKVASSTGDWVRMVEADKEELGIGLTDEEIQVVSKEMFKTYIKKKDKINYLKHLNTLKSKHSKYEFLECSDVKMADYIKDPRLNTSKKQLLFSLRRKTLDVQGNFKRQNQSPWCTPCGLFQETQGHLLQCPPLVKNIKYLKGQTSKLEEKCIYSNIEQRHIIVNIYSDILEERENLQHKRNNEVVT